jgi:hypothetical protein
VLGVGCALALRSISFEGIIPAEAAVAEPQAGGRGF